MYTQITLLFNILRICYVHTACLSQYEYVVFTAYKYGTINAHPLFARYFEAKSGKGLLLEYSVTLPIRWG